MKRPISATIDEGLITWLDKILKENSQYRNKSHIIEMALENLKNESDRIQLSKKKR